MHARGDIPNDMRTNGELFLQRRVLDLNLRKPNVQRRLVLLDVGANLGDWTAYALAHIDRHWGSDCPVSIIAFEPDPAAAEHLRHRFQARREVRIEQIALSSRSGTAAFFRTGSARGTNSLYPASNEPLDILSIRTEAVSSYCANRGIDRIDLMKVDAEGHDCEVILGAKELLQTERITLLQFEYNHRWIFARRFLKDVFEIIGSLPYSLGKLQSDHVLIFDAWHFELERFFEGNYVLIHERAAGWLPARKLVWDKSNTAKIRSLV